MKHLYVLPLLGVVGLATSESWAQYGLYGSPELLQLPAVQSPATPPQLYPSTRVAPGAPFSPVPFDAASAARPIPSYGPDSNAGNLVQASAGLAAPQPLPPEPASPAGQGVISRMLEETGPSPSPMDQPPGQLPEGPAGCGPAGCPDAVCYEPPMCNWFASAAGLYMTRDKGNRLWTTYETDNEANQMMNSQDADFDWTGGWEATFGRYFGCRQYGVAATYWGLADFESSASMLAPLGGSIGTPLDLRYVSFGESGPLLSDYFDDAQEHRLWRRSEVHSVEINFIRFSGNYAYDAAPPCAGAGSVWSNDGSCTCDTCDPLAINWSVGARYFRLADALRFGSLSGAATDWSDLTEQAYLRDRVENNLIGAQCGWDVNYRVACRWQVFARPKIGIYDNHIEHHFDLYRGDGAVPQPQQASGVSGTYPVTSRDDAVSFMTQVDLGLNWEMTRWCNAFVGYRVLFATGIALPEEQVPFYVVDVPEISHIDHNGDLVLHGAFAGLEFNF